MYIHGEYIESAVAENKSQRRKSKKGTKYIVCSSCGCCENMHSQKKGNLERHASEETNIDNLSMHSLYIS